MSEKVAIVTGAGTGIGRAIALALAGRGYAILAAGRRKSPLDETRAEIVAGGGVCEVQQADVADPLQVDAMVRAAAKLGRIEVLVNNAGIAVHSGIESLDLEAFDTMLRVNSAGVVYTCRAAWPVMRKAGGGTIVNISSMAADDPFKGLAVYGATKAFVNLLTKGLAAEGKSSGIRVFAVGPGAVETEMLRGAFPDFPKEHTLPPSAIADMVVTLTEASCQYCTGQTFYVRR